MKKFLMIGALALTLVFTANVQESKAQSQAEVLEALGFTQSQILTVMALLESETPVVATGESLLSDHDGVNLQVGVLSPRVLELQTCMNTAGFSTGTPDGVFGPLTAAGVRSFQASQGLVVDGIVGVATTPAFQAACPVTVAAPVAGTLPAGCTSTTGFSVTTGERCDSEGSSESSNPEFPATGGNEASLEDFDLSSEDDAEEGEMTHVATIEFDVEDGDFLMERLDLSFFPSDTLDEDEPWDTFETITLMIDGDEVAEVDVEDEDDWQEEDYTDDNDDGVYDKADDSAYSFRINGINYVVEDNDTVEIEVFLTTADSVDDAGETDAWTIFVEDEGVRGVDTAGITQYIGDEDQLVTFDIDEEGGDESIEFSSSSDDPDEATLVVDNDDESDFMGVFVFELEAEENDIEVNDIEILVTTVGGNYNDIVNDARLVVDGDEYDDFDVISGGTAAATLRFDIDGDFSVDGDDSVDVTLELEFKDTNDGARYSNGATVQASTVFVDGEGDDDVDDNTSVSGDTHTLVAEGLIDSNEDKSSDTQELGDDTIAVFTFELDLEAIEDTFYIADDQGTGTEANGFGVSILGAGTITDVTISSTSADLVNGGLAYEINEGNTESFTVQITVVGSSAGVASVRAVIDDVTYDTQSNLLGDDASLLLGAPDYRSGTETINNAN